MKSDGLRGWSRGAQCARLRQGSGCERKFSQFRIREQERNYLGSAVLALRARVTWSERLVTLVWKLPSGLSPVSSRWRTKKGRGGGQPGRCTARASDPRRQRQRSPDTPSASASASASAWTPSKQQRLHSYNSVASSSLQFCVHLHLFALFTLAALAVPIQDGNRRPPPVLRGPPPSPLRLITTSKAETPHNSRLQPGGHPDTRNQRAHPFQSHQDPTGQKETLCF